MAFTLRKKALFYNNKKLKIPVSNVNLYFNKAENMYRYNLSRSVFLHCRDKKMNNKKNYFHEKIRMVFDNFFLYFINFELNILIQMNWRLKFYYVQNSDRIRKIMYRRT